MTSRIHLRDKIYLIGNYSQQIIESKLPSIKQVLDVLFYNLRVVKLSVRESARLAIQEVLIFWEKARIPIKETKHCIAKLEALYEKWRNLQKHARRVIESHKQKETEFVSKFNDLFDIAHANALDMMTIEEDKLFLISQRQKDRPGFMAGIDFEHAKKEKRREERKAKAWARKQRSVNELKELGKTILLETSSLSSSSTSIVDEITVDDVNVQEQTKVEYSYLSKMESGPSKPKKKRGKREIMTVKLGAVFDRCKVSDRNAVHILIAAAKAFELDVENLVINGSSIRRYREHKETAKIFKNLFKETDLDAVVVHWDGKLIPCITQQNVTVDRLPVIVTSGDIEQLLGIPQIEASTGQQQAAGIYELLNDWALTDKVKALCCDTTASNTGHLKGACIMLEQMLERDLLYLPCRHHIFEIILKSIFDEKVNLLSTGPNVTIFKRFQQSWSQIDQTKFKPGIKDPKIKESLKNNLEEILEFVKSNLVEQQPRED